MNIEMAANIGGHHRSGAPEKAASPLYAPRPGLRPYRQGELDALCGVYAIINAIRWAAWPREIKQETVEALFARISTHAVMALPLPSLCSAGTTVPQLRKLLRYALAFIKAEAGLHLTLETIAACNLRIGHEAEDSPATRGPSHHACRTSRGVVASARLGEAFILHVTYTLPHWSVFERLEGRRLHLFDSSGWRNLPLRRLTFHSAFRLANIETTTPPPQD